MSRRSRTGDFWLQIYNAKNKQELYQLIYAEASKTTKRVNDVANIVVPEAADVHIKEWKHFQKFVDRWTIDSLRKSDWSRATHWAGGAFWFDNIFPKVDVSGDWWARLQIRQFKKNKFEPFTECYCQVLSRIARERLGLPQPRPIFCSACGILFEPRQVEQRWCSARCRNRDTQRQYRAAKKETGEVTSLSIQRARKS